MSRTHRNKRPRYGKTFDPRGRLIDKDTGEHEAWLALHPIGDGYESRGGALLLSRNGERAAAVFVPKVWLDLGEPCGAIISTNFGKAPPTMERAIVYPVSGPGFIFDEKGLR